jgi:hypothetical protein
MEETQTQMLWVGDKLETMEVDKNPFSIDVLMFEALFYSPNSSLIITIHKEYEQGALEVYNYNLTNG